MHDEILDLVNDQDEVVGKLSRAEIYAQGLHNYRAVNGFLMSDEGKLWIPKRVASKKIYPNALDFSSAGHVDSGEDYLTAFKRETMEELNLDIERFSWRALGKRTPAGGACCFQMIYEIRTNVEPAYNASDFSEAYWLSPQELLRMIDEGVYAKSDLAPTVREFYV